MQYEMNNGSQIFTSSLLCCQSRSAVTRHCGQIEKPEPEKPGSGLMVRMCPILVPRASVSFGHEVVNAILKREVLGMRMHAFKFSNGF